MNAMRRRYAPEGNLCANSFTLVNRTERVYIRWTLNSKGQNVTSRKTTMTMPRLKHVVEKGPRTIVPLAEKTNRKLTAYLAAAGAAGIGLLAATQPAEARVIYTQTNISVGDPVAIDLNGDGTKDITFIIGGGGSNEVFFYASIPVGNGVFKSGAPAFFGVPFGPGEQFAGSVVRLASFYCCSAGTGSGGQWAGKTNRYLGVRFLISGTKHYGWIRMSVVNLTATITGYAFETIPNKSIKAGTVGGPLVADNATTTLSRQTPATLGLLARGSEAISIWRREE